MARDGQPGGLIGRALERLEEATGQAAVPSERLDMLEAIEQDYRLLNRELEDVGWSLFDYMGNRPQEMSKPSRLRVVQRARYVWMNDPNAGAAVELMNDFVFGRGVPPPRCKDKLVQEIVDEAWNDPDNQRVLTSYDSQMALGTDLALQSNLYVLFFMDGDDGKVKLSMLRHDDVDGYVPHPKKRHRVLWYLAKQRELEWDYKLDSYKPVDLVVDIKPTYYADIDGLAASEEEDDMPDEGPPEERVGDGLVFHVRINRYSEQQMGTPRFQRTLRWYTAYNDFVKARLNMAEAAASIIMKRKVKGSPATLARDAGKALSRRSLLAGGATLNDPSAPGLPMRPASIVEENESADHQALSLSTGAGQAQQDATQIRAPLSAAERWPQSYFGDPSNSNLATATSLELPVLKAVESRQEVFEGLFRKFIDTVIERAVAANKIPEVVEPGEEPVPVDREMPQESYEDQAPDEESTQRDLSYEFSMPSPLRRMMTDLVTSIQAIATTFDPNNTNIELSRALLTIALGEALEVQDPADIVEKIFPPGYVPPEVQAMMAQQPPASPLPMSDPNALVPSGPDGKPAGAPGTSTRPEDMRSGAYNAQEAFMRGRDGRLIEWPLAEHLKLLPEPETRRATSAQEEVGALFRSEVVSHALEVLDVEAGLLASGENGKP